MNEGALFATGTLEQLRGFAESGLTVQVKASYLPDTLAYRKVGALSYEIKVNSEAEISVIVKNIVGAGGNLYHISVHQLSLEEIYFSLIDVRRIQREGKVL